VLSDGETFDFSNAALKNDRLSYESDGIRQDMFAHINQTKVTLKSSDRIVQVDVLAVDDLANNSAASAAEGNLVVAVMPGQIVETLVKPGDQVEEGQSVVVLEAMKLLQQLPAPCSGIITQLNCNPGETVQSGAVLAVIETKE